MFTRMELLTALINNMYFFTFKLIWIQIYKELHNGNMIYTVKIPFSGGGVPLCGNKSTDVWIE